MIGRTLKCFFFLICFRWENVQLNSVSSSCHSYTKFVFGSRGQNSIINSLSTFVNKLRHDHLYFSTWDIFCDVFVGWCIMRFFKKVKYVPWLNNIGKRCFTCSKVISTGNVNIILYATGIHQASFSVTFVIKKKIKLWFLIILHIILKSPH